jgi:hypothetical protein
MLVSMALDAFLLTLGGALKPGLASMAVEKMGILGKESLVLCSIPLDQ